MPENSGSAGRRATNVRQRFEIETLRVERKKENSDREAKQHKKTVSRNQAQYNGFVEIVDDKVTDVKRKMRSM